MIIKRCNKNIKNLYNLRQKVINLFNDGADLKLFINQKRMKQQEQNLKF